MDVWCDGSVPSAWAKGDADEDADADAHDETYRCQGDEKNGCFVAGIDGYPVFHLVGI
jgi:hypothetical protein